MKTAIYYIASANGALKERKGVVVEEGKGPDGPVVTLAETPASKPFIVRAPVSTVIQGGHAVLGEPLTEAQVKALKGSKAELKKLATELRQAANAAKEAFDKAAEAAELAGPDAENAEALALAALEAEEAYKAADKAADEAEAALK